MRVLIDNLHALATLLRRSTTLADTRARLALAEAERDELLARMSRTVAAGQHWYGVALAEHASSLELQARVVDLEATLAELEPMTVGGQPHE